MPGKIKVKVLAGRNLPVMDRASDTTDAFVEIKFGGITHKTDVCRKSLNPHWNSTEWYRFEVDESELQDEPLQLRLMDHDTYSANDAIGKVVISLAPLLAREANEPKSTTAPHGGAVMSGWIPVFDTMHGIRGELNVIVKVELFSDFNKYKTSSCGVQFFHCPLIPPGYRATAIHGFVEELVVNDDPEYQWIDKIRTPRASNEARQVAFIKLSNQVQRLVGLKATELGANAVVGYLQDFDLEGEAGVVARAVGTAVSITPLPTHSQQANMPPCTQQQLKKYLDILATDNDDVTDLNQYYQTHQEELQKLLNILNPNAPSLLDEPVDDEDDKSLDITRQSSTNTYAGNVSLYQDDYVSHKSLKHISEDQNELNRLLNRKDDYESDSSSPLQKMKKLKTSFFAKRFSLRSRKSDKDIDLISLKSNSSEISRISIGDIKCEFKKLKRLKKPKFTKIVQTKEDEGQGMASILARSVLHAQTSLACINESQDSEHSPGSTLRRTSESEPTISMSEEEKTKNPGVEVSEDVIIEDDNAKKVPEIHFQSLTNISSEEVAPKRERKISESCPTSPIIGRNDNLLKLPNETGYYGSISSALSGESSEMYSSSEEDDESSDIKTDTDRSIETTSSVVRSVLNHEVDPAIVAQMNRKLSILERMTPEPHEIKCQGYIDKCKSADSLLHGMENIKNNETEVVTHEASTSTRELNTCVKKAHSHSIKFHNPFAHKKASNSISAPSSPTEKTGFVYRSSKRIKRQLCKISKSSMIKSLSHYSLLPKKKQVMKTLSRPSSSGVLSKTPSETVLGSHFLSYSDLISLDKEGLGTYKKLHRSDELVRPKFSMYIGSEPTSRASLSCSSSPPRKDEHDQRIHKKEKSGLKSTGLVHTAMETMLIDRVQSLLIPTSPDHISSETKQFFSDVSEKLEKVEESRNQQIPIEYVDSSIRRKAQSVSPETSQIVSVRVRPFIDDYRSNKYIGEKLINHKSTGLVHTAMETILMDKVHNLMGPTTPESTKSIPCFENKNITSEEAHKKESPALVHTAVETILLDKVQTVLPEISESVTDKFESQNSTIKDVDKTTAKANFTIKKPTGLVATAMKTILMDKVQSLCGPIISESIPDKLANNKDTKEKNEWKESTGLVHTAMKTILADKVQYLVGPQTSQSNQTKEIHSATKLEEIGINEILKSPGLVHTAMETMLIDKDRPSIDSQSLEMGIKAENDYLQENDSIIKINEDMKNDKDLALVTTTVETMFHDKVKRVLDPITTNDDRTKIENNVNEGNYIKNAEMGKTIGGRGFIKNATETIRLDKDTCLGGIERNTFATKEFENNKSHEEIETNLTRGLKSDKTDRTKDGKLPKLKEKKLVRQDSVHSVTESLKTSNENISNVSYKVTKPMLQHFHPIISGAQLETIPSLPESSLDHTESLDVEGVEINNVGVSVCGNSHAVCGVDRNERDRDKCEKDKGSPRHARHESYGGREPAVQPAHAQNSSLNASSTPMGIHRRSSDSDLSVTPKGSSLNMSAGNVGTGGGAILKPSMNSNNLDMLEYPFLTMTEFPPGFIVHIGGTVCARSVKLVDGGGESGARALWWAELRTELRAHARALRCNAVIAYVDTAAICEDVIVLSASGTAVVINLDCDFNADLDPAAGSRNTIDEVDTDACSVAHVPYSPGSGPYRAELSTCGGCRRARVPAVLLATCAKPNRLTAYAKAVTLTAVAGRVRRAPPTAEPGARDISDQLPFLEYELHKLLLAKLRMQGANALFSLQTQIAIGERCVMALASGTAYRLAALPPPTPPRIKASENDKEALELQKALWDSFTANKAANGYDIGVLDHCANGVLPEIEGDDPPVLDLCADKDACVLELDEAEDVETARALAVRRVLPPVYSSNLKALRGAPPHAFAQVWRGRIAGSGVGSVGAGAAERHVSRALHSVAYKLRRLSPCALAATRFQLELPEDEIQLVVSGTAIPLQDPSKPDHSSENGDHGNGPCGDTDDDIFTLDEEQLVRTNRDTEVEEKPSVNGQMSSMVSLTTLSGVCGARAARRVCALRLLFVRETTTVRELGGLSGFLHTFTCEVLAIARAYTAALGGNALTSFYLTQLMLQDNAHKNQGQCLLSVGGDVVHMTY